MNAAGIGEVLLFGASPGEIASREAPLHQMLATKWLLGHHSANTRDAYARDIKAWFAWCERQGFPILGVERAHVDLYRVWLEQSATNTDGTPRRHYSPATVARKLTAVSSFYTYVVQDSHAMDTNPALRVKRPEVSDESTTRGLDMLQARAMLAAADAMGQCEAALIWLLLTTGMRVSEACGADTRQMGTERGRRVIVITRKRGRRQTIVLAAPVAERLDRYIGGRAGRIFLYAGAAMDRHRAAKTVAAVARAAGLGDLGVTPHVLRHAATTLSMDGDPEHGIEGASLRDVQTLMGHIDPRTTNRYDRARHNVDRSAVHTLTAALTGGATS